LSNSLDVGTLIKVWNDGNQHLAKIKQSHRHPQLIHYIIIRTIYCGSDYNKFINEEITSINNIVKTYGILTFDEHRDLFPEDWI